MRLICLCLITTVVIPLILSAKENPSVELIRSAGYPVETHRTVTKDGYLIVLHRIPRPPPARVVLYFHGIFGSSIDVVLRGPNTGLAFILSNAGFDVWLANLRGSIQEPLTVNSTKKNPWDFCWDDNAQYDFPAIMDYVLSTTGAAKVSTIGVSMAGNVEIGGLALHLRLNHRINIMVFLAPTSRLKNIRILARRAAPYWKTLQRIITGNGPKANWTPIFDHKHFQQFLSHLCSLPNVGAVICASLIFTWEGVRSDVDKTLVPKISKYYPHPTPSKSIIHFLQLINSGRFCRFDYGSEKENIKHYKQPYPPDYDISKVTVPTAIFYSQYDTIASSKDVEWLASQLNTVLAYSVPKKNFAHFSFMWDPDIKNLIYDKVLDLLLRNW